MNQKSKSERYSIGLIANYVEDKYQSELWTGIVGFCEENDIDLLIFGGILSDSPWGYNFDKIALNNFINEKNLDGLIVLAGPIATYAGNERIIKFLEYYSSRMPTVSVAVEAENVPSILIDNKAGMRKAIAHLINEHHYRKIAFIKGASGHQEADERFAAYKEMLAAYDIPINDDYITTGSFTKQAGEEAVKLFFDDRKLPVDALVCADDAIAYGVFEALKKRQIRVPNDVAVIGFDDTIGSISITPPLTTVRQPLLKQGRIAASLVLDMINGKKVAEKILMPTKLVIRQSCGCLPENVKSSEIKLDMMNTDVGNVQRILYPRKDSLKSEVLEALINSDIDQVQCSLWVTDLIDALYDDLQDGVAGAQFLKTLNDIILEVSWYEKDFNLWENALHRLEKKILHYLKSSSNTFWVKYLFQTAFMIINEFTIRYHAHFQMKIEFQFWTLHEVSRYLLTTFELNKLKQVIVEQFPKIGMRFCAVVLYKNTDEKPSDDWTLPEYSRLFSSYNLNTGYKNTEDTYFLTEDFVPREVLRQDKRYNLLIMPLCFREEKFGYIIFEMVKSEIVFYENLRRLISTALKGALLIGEIKETEHKLKDAKERAETASRLKSEFLANMSHEIRTPMNLVLGFTDLLLDDEADREKMEKLDIIKSAGKHLLNLINDILDFSKIEAGKIDIESKPIYFKDMLKQISHQFIGTAHENNIEFNVAVDESVPDVVTGDEHRIKQIILNLLSNAFKFTKKGTITFSCEYHDGNASIVIKDTGIGIPPDKLDAIFSPFEQADSSTARRYGGTGLGLSITRKLVALLSGTINVESTLKKGSIFLICLPLPVVTDTTSLQMPVSTAVTDGHKHDENGRKMVKGWLAGMKGDTLLEDIVLDGIKKLPGDILKLENAILNNDKKQIKIIAHDIKGVSGNLGMKEIHRIARTIDLEIGKKVYDIAFIGEKFKALKMLVESIPAEYFQDRQLEKKIPAERVKEVCSSFEILLAEDNKMNQKLISALLSKMHIQCDIAPNGRVVIEKLRNSTYDLLLLDIQMPIMDGVETIKYIRQHAGYDNLYVIAITAHALKGDAEKYLGIGCNDYLSKPIDRELFRKKIEALVVKKEAALKGAAEAGETEPVVPLSSPVVNDSDINELKRIIIILKRNRDIFDPSQIYTVADDLHRLTGINNIDGLYDQLIEAADTFNAKILGEIVNTLEAFIVVS